MSLLRRFWVRSCKKAKFGHVQTSVSGKLTRSSLDYLSMLLKHHSLSLQHPQALRAGLNANPIMLCSVGGFEDGIVGNMGIGAFLVKKDELRALDTGPAINETGKERPEKRRRIEPYTGIQRFFKMDSTDEHDDEFGSQYLSGIDNPSAENADSNEEDKAASSNLPRPEATAGKTTLSNGLPGTHQQHITDYMCDRCSAALESVEALQSHQDFHFAKDLEHEERTRVVPKQSGVIPNNKKSTGTASKKRGSRNSKPEKGQSKLAFG